MVKDNRGHDARNPSCECRRCERYRHDGERRLELHIPNECLFDGDEHTGPLGSQQNRYDKYHAP